MDKTSEVFTNLEYKQLKDSVDKRMKINVISYSLVEKTEKQIDLILEEILKRYNKSNIRGSIYTCIKELAVNGTKANLKSVFFEKKNISLNDPEESKRGTEDFKKVLEKSKEKNFGKVVYDRGFYVKIGFEYSDDGLTISVFNNCLIPATDRERIITKLEKSKTYESIADYYMDAFDDTEGAGMGLAMVVIILKGMGIDVENFKIDLEEKSGMLATIRFPFDQIDDTVAEAMPMM